VKKKKKKKKKRMFLFALRSSWTKPVYCLCGGDAEGARRRRRRS